MQSATEINQIAIEFKKHAPKGFILDANNGGQIQAYLKAKNLPVTIETISAAIKALEFSLDWEPGFVPTAPVVQPVARDTRTQKQKAHDAGISSYEREGTHADTGESSWARDIREGREAHAARNKKRERDEQRYRETHQTVMTANGRISCAQSEAVNKAAALRHAQEDSLESGRPITVATGPRSIPSSETDPNYQAWLRTASADDIKIFLSRKGRSHLMR